MYSSYRLVARSKLVEVDCGFKIGSEYFVLDRQISEDASLFDRTVFVYSAYQ